MKLTIKILLALVFILFFSCEDQGLFVKCPDCSSDEPLNTNLEIKLDLPAPGQVTKVKFMKVILKTVSCTVP